MKRSSDSRRVNTESSLTKLYEKSIKIQGIIYLQPKTGNRKTSSIQIKPTNKLLYHCYKRYKSFPFQFDYIYEENEESGFYGPNFGEFNAVHALQNQVDYMLYCTGIIKSEQNRDLPTIQMLFYEKLAAVYDVLVKEAQHSIKINIMAINEESAFDLIGQTNVEIRQIHNTKVPGESQICFSGGKQQFPQTLYEMYQLIKKSLYTKNKVIGNSYYIIYAELIPKTGKQDKKKLLLVNATKDIFCAQKNWDNGSNLVLNKCILGLFDRMQNNKKQSYSPFRDSRITRIIKPFLTSNTRVDVVGFANMLDEDYNLSTLNLVKNLSSLKVPLRKSNKLQKTSKQNPETPSKHQKIKDYVSKTQENEVKQQRRPHKSAVKLEVQAKVNLMEEVRKNAKAQMQISKNLQRIRQQIKLVKRRKQVSTLGLPSLEKSQLLQHLQEQQLAFKQQKQREFLQQTQKLNKSRLETINKSISKVQKLKLLKEYYTIAMSNQKQEIEEFIQQQQMVNQFYQERLTNINNDLKKSPKQLLEEDNPEEGLSEKRYMSAGKTQKSSLPYIDEKVKRRISYLKEKVKKGRAEYSNFLSKNVQQYQSYSTPIHQL